MKITIEVNKQESVQHIAYMLDKYTRPIDNLETYYKSLHRSIFENGHRVRHVSLTQKSMEKAFDIVNKYHE